MVYSWILTLSIFPTWSAFHLKIHSRWMRHWPARWATFLRWNVLILCILGIVIFVLFGATGSRLYEQPAAKCIIERFFQEPFILMILLLILWFVFSLKPNYLRIEEYKFLNSLPLSANKIGHRFISLDCFRFSWVPGIFLFSYAGMLSILPIPFFLRLSILTLLNYFAAITWSEVIHLLLSLRAKKRGPLRYPYQLNPIIQVGIITEFTFLQLAWIFLPQWISGYRFWLLFLCFILCSYFLIISAGKLFKKWQESNLAWQNVSVQNRWHNLSYQKLRQIFDQFPPRVKPSPLLLKNIIRIMRTKTSISNVVLTAFFIGIAYLLSRNNATTGDRISVLLWLSILYAFLFATQSVDRLGKGFESPLRIYVLPLRKLQFYFSGFIPAILWSAGVFMFTALLVFIGEASTAAAWYWAKSMFVSFIFLGIAFNCSIALYPETKKAQSRFIYWTFVLMLFTVFLYRYWVPIAVIVLLLSTISTRKMRLYKT